MYRLEKNKKKYFSLIADIQFWNNRKSLEGLSVRSVFFNVFQSVVVLLYVLDNETNTLIKVSCFVGLAIEVWKIHKVVDFSIDPENAIMGVIPRYVYLLIIYFFDHFIFLNHQLVTHE